jgi:hypothetical protein
MKKALIALLIFAGFGSAVPQQNEIITIRRKPSAGGITAPTYTNKASGTSFPLTVTSTGAGHFVGVITIYTTQPTAVTLGSQSLTKQSTCSPSMSGYTACLWYTLSATGSQTSVTVTGGSGVSAGAEYELTAPSAALDAAATCTGSTTCAVTISPSVANEAIVAGFVCLASATSIAGSPTSTGNVVVPAGNAAGLDVSATTSETLTVNSTCGSGSAGNATGAAWSVK